jgi:hypothetical protein
MRNEETDLSFAEFGHPKRPYTAPRNETELEEAINYLKRLVRREGFASELCSPAQRSFVANPRPSGSRASFARDALRQRSWLAKKNPNLRKINDLRSSDRRIAAYRGTQDGTQRRKRQPRRHQMRTRLTVLV